MRYGNKMAGLFLLAAVFSLSINVPNAYASDDFDMATRSVYNSDVSTDETEEDVAARIIKSLNETGTLPSNTSVTGRQRNADGTATVAIATEGSDGNLENVVVDLDQNGRAMVHNLETNSLKGNEDSQTAQEVYDTVLKNNDMTDSELSDLNETLGGKLQSKIDDIALKYHLTSEQVAQVTTGTANLAGLVMLGATGTKQTATTPKSETKGRRKEGNKSSDNNSYDPDLYGDGTEGHFTLEVDQAGYDGLTPQTKKALNMLSTAYYNKTGYTLRVSSGYRPWSSGSYHADGIAFDVDDDEMDDKQYRVIYQELAESLGLTPLDEWTGEPGQIYAHGDNFHVTVHNQDTFGYGV